MMHFLFKIYTSFKRMQLKTIKSFGKNNFYDLKITICDLNPEIADVLGRVFAKEDHIEILQGDILNLSADALLSPANSFGDMGGGLDKSIDDFFQGEAQQKVQELIQDKYFGEMPVGVAEVLTMNYRQFPYLIVAPTMRIPGNISKSIHAYLAMRAALIAILQHNQAQTDKIRHIALPCLCTGVGGMPYQESAEQMHTAMHQILSGNWRQVIHPAVAPYALGAKWCLSEKLNKFG